MDLAADRHVPMDKAEALKKLEAEMRQDQSLPLSTNLVFGEGSLNPAALFIGEAPGQKEDELVRPFVGRGGQLLRECIRGIGWKEEDVYITNIVKRRPPENRDPLPDEIAAYRPYLARQIEALAPAIIVTLGRFSMNYFLPDAKITRDQGKIFISGRRCVVPMLHPAAALRSPEMMRQFRETFARLPVIVERCEEVLKDLSDPKQKPKPQKLF